MNRERTRMADEAGAARWRQWGPYLSERQWGTVREDYSPDGEAWTYFPFEHAHLRAYRWGEDGLLGMCDEHAHLCLAPALWNERDERLKERLFGLTSQQGNHGEDLKEVCWYEDALPSNVYNRAVYRYPQAAFPYERLRRENERRGRDEPEFELIETGALDDGRYFDLVVEYGKSGPTDLVARFTLTNHGPDAAPAHLLAQLWFRNTWSWGERGVERPLLAARDDGERVAIDAHHHELGDYTLHGPRPDHVLVTDNDTNQAALGQGANGSPHVKDAFHRFLVHGDRDAVNPARRGTKAALVYRRVLGPGESFTVTLRLTNAPVDDPLGPSLDAALAAGLADADAFYEELAPRELDDEARRAQRAALAGLLWNRQAYRFDVARWLDGDEGLPAPPEAHRQGPNRRWRHLRADHVLSVPDKWEFPWFASWDMAFHCIPLALVDAAFARQQLLLMVEPYRHPEGQIPGYEWDFGDENPPVLAWAAWRVYGIERALHGRADTAFLGRMFDRLGPSFTWWLHHHEQRGEHIFDGGRLGLDNIGPFDRSKPPGGVVLEQADATGWMAMFALDMLLLAVELSRHDPAREADAVTYLDHFVAIADAMHGRRPGQDALFDPDDGFFFDRLRWPDGRRQSLRVRSMVGLIPLCAVLTLDASTLGRLPTLARRLHELAARPGHEDRALVSLDGGHARLSPLGDEPLRKLLAHLLDEEKFLSDYGLRSVSREHAAHPFAMEIGGESFELAYEPGESTGEQIGGTSNWRGPIWLPMNFLLIETLQKLHRQRGEGFRVAFPTGSDRTLDLDRVATSLVHRLIRIIRLDPATGRRPGVGAHPRMQTDPAFRDRFVFHEYYHGDDGSGRGAAHQTGWTALLAKLLLHMGRGDESVHHVG